MKTLCIFVSNDNRFRYGNELQLNIILVNTIKNNDYATENCTYWRSKGNVLQHT